MKIVLAVFIGGGLGSVLRFWITQLSIKYIPSSFPWGTFISNMLACLTLALVVLNFKGLPFENSIWKFFIIAGFCGGFSTFSTFSFENYQLLKSDHTMIAVANVVVSVGLGILTMIVLLKKMESE